MARASAKRGRRPRANARPAQRVAAEPAAEAPADAVAAEPTPEVPAVKPEKKPVEKKQAVKKAEAKARPARAQRPDEGMFFIRLRTHAKWVFAVLAGVFALSFVALGVGTGVSGSSLGDVLRDVFGGGSGTPSVSEAQQKVDENPNDAEALRDLATAQQAAGSNAAAAATLERYLKLRPNDTSIAAQLAALYDRQAREATAEASALAEQTTASFVQSTFSFPDSNGFLGALGAGPIDNALSAGATLQAQAANDRAMELFRKASVALERVTKARPQDATAWLQLGQAASAAGEQEKAVTAYEKFLELAPDDPNVDFVKSQLELLKQGEVVQG